MLWTTIGVIQSTIVMTLETFMGCLAG